MYADKDMLQFRLSPVSRQYLTHLAATGANRNPAVTVALGMVASAFAPTPADRIDSPESYFRTQAGVPAMEFINAINEICPVDYNNALEAARNLFIWRYETASNPFGNIAGYSHGCDGIVPLLGLSKHLPPDLIQVMQTQAPEVARHFEQLQTIACALKGE